MSFEKGLLKLVSSLVHDNVIGLTQSVYLKYLCFRKDPRLLFQIKRYINKSINYDTLIDNLDKLIANESSSLFDEIFIDCTLSQGKILSREERSSKNLSYGSLTYGEIDYQNFYTILRRINPISSNAIFYDLGSGTGRAIIAARLTQDFSKCIGIEILENLHNAAVKVVDKFNSSFRYMLHQGRNDVDIHHASILDYNWSNGDVVFANSTCFDSNLMDDISKQALKLKIGAIIITFTKELTIDPLNQGYPAFEILDKTRYNMSWGPATVFIHRRLSSERIAPFDKAKSSVNRLDRWKDDLSESSFLHSYFGKELNKIDNSIKSTNVIPTDSLIPTLDEVHPSALVPSKLLSCSYTSKKVTGSVKTLQYLIRAPADYSVNNYTNMPLVLFLHGASARGSNLDQVKAFALPHILEHDTSIKFPAILISPQCPLGHEWKEAGISSLLIELLDKVVEKYSIDKRKVYLTGISMGGLGSWMLAARNPSYFAAMIPMCGGGSPVYAKLLAHMPIWFAHAVNDNVISVNETDALVKALKDEGGQDIQYSRYEESNDASAQAWMIGHNVWDTAYRDRVLWNWLFSKSL